MDYRQYNMTLGKFTYIVKLAENAVVELDKNKLEALEIYLKNTPTKGGPFRLRNGIKNGNKFSPKYYPSNWIGGSKAMIKTYNVSKTISRESLYTTVVLGEIEVGQGISQDYDNYQNEGHTNGKNTAVAVGSVAGEVLGAIGSTIGPEGTVIGSILGNYFGGELGTEIGKNLVEKAYE